MKITRTGINRQANRDKIDKFWYYRHSLLTVHNGDFMNYNETHSYQALMRYAERLTCNEFHVKFDPETGLHAIIAIHSNTLGPAIGGCRLKPYTNAGMAMKDVLQLSYMMTLKAAISDLPHGGAKSVIIAPDHMKDRHALFQSFGDFVHQMNGRYITAMDVGTETTDMDAIAERTPYVIGARGTHASHDDPSFHTALGVLRGIQACVQFKLNRDSLDGIRVAIQGAGHVGYELAKLLAEKGAQLSICDPRDDAVQRCVKEFNATAVALDDIYDVDCDVFAPCALGGIINNGTIARLKASIIAGSANSQLAHKKFGAILQAMGILYAPDFVINSGGLIQAAMIYDYNDVSMAIEKIDNLYNILLNIFERASNEKLSTTEVARRAALEKLNVKE